MIKNRKAYFNYHVLDKIEAGIVLTGTEAKSARLGKIDISNAFCLISEQLEVELHQLKITPYAYGNIFNHDSKRIRKLLLHKNEIRKLSRTLKSTGLALIPLALYFKRGNLKVLLGVCKGKKIQDKEKLRKARDLAHAKAEQDY
ncbi:MAG: SsrA-binding protein SmpB [SAR324 cluster bacterium]|nr:SsrA-binding protein SmpB [SAR324 cluster bacterium]